jgi:hypothetical protein
VVASERRRPPLPIAAKAIYRPGLKKRYALCHLFGGFSQAVVCTNHVKKKRAALRPFHHRAEHSAPLTISAG